MKSSMTSFNSLLLAQFDFVRLSHARIVISRWHIYRALATGSGDSTVRFWDLNTELPQAAPTSGHHGPILCLAWSPDGLRLASGCQAGFICLWTQRDKLGSWELDAPSPLIQPSLSRSPANSKSRWIRSIAWRPFHLWVFSIQKSECSTKPFKVTSWHLFRYINN